MSKPPQTPNKPTSTQSLPFFDPSFFAHCKKNFRELLSPQDYSLTDTILLQTQKDDPVLSTVYAWLKQKHKLFNINPKNKASSFLSNISNNINLIHMPKVSFISVLNTHF